MFEPVDTRDRAHTASNSSSNGCAGSKFVREEEGFVYEDGESAVAEKVPSPRVIGNAFIYKYLVNQIRYY